MFLLFPEHDMPAVHLHGGDHAVEIDREARHTALADGGIQFIVHLLQLLFQSGDIDIICVMAFEDLQNLALDVGIGGTAQRDPYGAVAVFDRERGEILEELGQFAVVIIADVKIRKDLDKTGADLAKAGLFALRIVVLDHFDDRGLYGLGRSKELFVADGLLIYAVPARAVIDIGICAGGIGRGFPLPAAGIASAAFAGIARAACIVGEGGVSIISCRDRELGTGIFFAGAAGALSPLTSSTCTSYATPLTVIFKFFMDNSS